MSNSLNKNLKGKTVLVKKNHVVDTLTDRRFLCEDGFGTHPNTNGTKIFGRWLSNNEKGCINGHSVESLVTN